MLLHKPKTKIMNITKRQLDKIKFLYELESLEIGEVNYDLSYRGGNLGFRSSDVARKFEVEEVYLPRNFGCYCNYLGGGMRGSVCRSTFNNNISKRKTVLLIALSEACKRVYINLEGDMNSETDEEGEKNWDAMATNAARAMGVKSAY